MYLQTDRFFVQIYDRWKNVRSSKINKDTVIEICELQDREYFDRPPGFGKMHFRLTMWTNSIGSVKFRSVVTKERQSRPRKMAQIIQITGRKSFSETHCKHCDSIPI